jgi:hypothetical protein
MKRSATSAPVALLPNIADTVPLRAISISTGMRMPHAPSAGFWQSGARRGDDPLLDQLESNSTAGGGRSSAAALATTSRPGCRVATLHTPSARKPISSTGPSALGCYVELVLVIALISQTPLPPWLLAKDQHVLRPSDPKGLQRRSLMPPTAHGHGYRRQ